MNRQSSFQARLVLPIILSVLWSLPAAAQLPTPPAARQANVREVIHGVEIVDPYRWLEDSASEETRNWVTAQNAYMHSLLDPIPMRPKIQKRVDEMFRHDFATGAFQEGGDYFFYKRKA